VDARSESVLAEATAFAVASFVSTLRRSFFAVVVAVLDAAMTCTAVLPAPAEMGASLHINGTGSSVLDSVFVCRRSSEVPGEAFAPEEFGAALVNDCREMQAGGVRVSAGDVRCLANGRLTQLAIGVLGEQWDADREVEERLARATGVLESLRGELQAQLLPEAILSKLPARIAPESLTLV